MDKYTSEEAFDKLFIFLKQRKDIYVKSKKSIGRFLEAVCWMMKSGAPWRFLPKEYGNWSAVFHRFNEWCKKDIWHELHLLCINDPDLEYIMIDTTVIRANVCAAGYKKGVIEALGRCKGGFSTKIHVVTDALGNLLKFNITPGQASDVRQAPQLLKGFSGSYVLGDKGYVSDVLRAQLITQGCIPVIPSRINAVNPHPYDKDIYKERYLVEFFFSKMKHFRRLAYRFDKSIRAFKSFISFFGAFSWLR